jgi:hypothetical protein
MELTEKYYKKIMENVRLTNFLFEISYEGNIGFHEVAKFFQMATPEQIQTFEELMQINDIKNAWELVQNVVGVRLKGL